MKERNEVQWNRRRVVRAAALGLPAAAICLRGQLHHSPNYFLSVFAHPATPLPEDVQVTVDGMCGEAPRLGLRRGSRGHRRLARLCPHCVEGGRLRITFTATERTFFLHHGSHEFVLRGDHASLPFARISPEQRNLSVTVANFRHPDLLDVRVEGRSAYPV